MKKVIYCLTFAAFAMTMLPEASCTQATPTEEKLLDIMKNRGELSEIIALLETPGINVNVKVNENDSIFSYYTPLHLAVYNELPEVVKILLEKGADVNAKGSFGQTPLHDAASRGFLDAMKLFLSKGADVNAKDRWDETPLHFAVDNKLPEVVKILLEKGADVNAKDLSGRTSLNGAAKSGVSEIVKLLIEQ
jgi:ankyrin repeat protein